jgi:hypothetical protein
VVRQMPALSEPPPCGESDLKFGLITNIMTLRETGARDGCSRSCSCRKCDGATLATQRQLKCVTAVFQRPRPTSWYFS